MKISHKDLKEYEKEPEIKEDRTDTIGISDFIAADAMADLLVHLEFDRERGSDYDYLSELIGIGPKGFDALIGAAINQQYVEKSSRHGYLISDFGHQVIRELAYKGNKHVRSIPDNEDIKKNVKYELSKLLAVHTPNELKKMIKEAQ